MEVSKRFLTGLNKYKVSYDDIVNNWYYMGGEKGHHLNYFRKHYPNDEIPEHSNNCICGHKIKNNCFITDGVFVLSIGESCINKFTPVRNKMCEMCGSRHRNRKDNICNKCRMKFKKELKDCIICFN